MHFDLTGGHPGVAPDFGTDVHLSLDEHNRLGADRGGASDHLGRAPARIERELHQSGTIAEVEEDQATQVAAAMHPPAETDALASVFAGQGPTEVCAVCGGRHAAVSLQSREGG